MNRLNDYADVVGKKYIEQLKSLALNLKKKKVIMVNSTKDGGGVAEILHRLVPLLNELDVHTKWETISGDSDFFNTTKNIHNALQGQRICFTREILDHYLEINKKNSEKFEFSEDFVFIHDPQPLPIISHFNKKNKNKWIWRCHIDLSKPDLNLWKFLKYYLLKYDASIFSLAKFSRILPHPQYLVAPSI
ncbi:MAG TPA: glycosyl transferase family 1, partial [Actinobacteria bacterium]|nr:glycosyl transferase family 1 [Actinomycetota bacterium]